MLELLRKITFRKFASNWLATALASNVFPVPEEEKQIILSNKFISLTCQSWELRDFLYRVLKWWRHKNEISEIMGFVRIFWKNNVQEAYLPKMSISGQIVSEIVAQLCLENSIQTLLNFFGFTPQKWSQRQFAPKCSFLASRPLGHCSFRISWQIP